jgi:thiamine biosynthesis lipoprotein
MIRSAPLMGTIVTIQVVGDGDERESGAREAAIERAFEWFRRIEACCTRFDPASELMRLTTHAGAAVPVSDTLFEAVRYALAVAEESRGAFDPTVGLAMERRGFDREYLSGRHVRTAIEDEQPSFLDVTIDVEHRTIRLARPLVLDLGAVAKGMAVDTAARELAPFKNFAIDAGGDLYCGGLNPHGVPWAVGIRHPRLDGELIEVLHVSDMAVCTSGDYERRGPDDGGHHILDARTGAPAPGVASVTVVAPTAMAADALATAAFALGPVEGLSWLEQQDVEGLMYSPALERFATRGMTRATAAVPPHA